MKNLNKWLLSAVTVLVMSVSFGQSNSLIVSNYYNSPIKIMAYAISDCNTTPTKRSSVYIVQPGNSQVIIAPFDISIYPNSEWLGLVYSENPPSYLSDGALENPFACSFGNGILQGIIGITVPTLGTGFTSANWVGPFLLELY